RLTPSFGVTAGAAYSSYPGLYDGVSAFVGTRFSFGDTSGFERGPNIRIENPRFDTIFPVLFKYYDTNPLGTVEIENISDETVEDLEVRVSVPQFMDTPKIGARIERLEPGERRTVALTALFTSDVLTITEGTKVAADVQVSHGTHDDGVSTTATLSTYDRNALRWDDNQKIAAFVTAKDEEVQNFAKNVAALTRRVQIDAVSAELQMAMAQYTALVEHGTSYVVDPSSAYEELSQNPLAVDFVQFPRQTLQFRAGDCDDLSATYCALLESVGVDTAFITIPGHIYMAFRLDMTPEEAESVFSDASDLIVRDDGSVWVPVETTVLDGGFGEAWATGARQWREHEPAGTAGFFPTKVAWQTYQPVAFSVSDTAIVQPRMENVEIEFKRELDQFVERELYRREQRFVARLRSNPRDDRTRNRLAVLYARYGKYDEAREELETILAHRTYAPALINLGNLAFAQESFREALGHYEAALRSAPNNAPALLGAARAAHRLENFDAAESRFASLSEHDPELAERFSYLGSGSAEAGTRASGVAEIARTLVWEEEL
ncbi:MAG: tetratricopeptide repeat protein, partial [Spirochaetes bacterium]|nr:tetratricopeptide repeat protein [Spirochaetota bacterium]